MSRQTEKKTKHQTIISWWRGMQDPLQRTCDRRIIFTMKWNFWCLDILHMLPMYDLFEFKPNSGLKFRGKSVKNCDDALLYEAGTAININISAQLIIMVWLSSTFTIYSLCCFQIHSTVLLSSSLIMFRLSCSRMFQRGRCWFIWCVDFAQSFFSLHVTPSHRMESGFI